MLFLDQPTQVGLSYDTLQNVTLDLGEGDVTVLQENDTIPEQNATLLVGTFPSQDGNNTALGSRNAAIAIWHFAQTWFQEFPAYHPNDSRVSISTESYGGRYGPAFAAFFEEQNQKIENGTWHDSDGENYIIHLDTLILINACIDRQVQWPSYPHMAYNNTYGIEAVNETIFLEMQDAYSREGGCRDQINECRALATEYDPENRGINETVNSICHDAETFCTENIRDRYITISGRNYYDVVTVDPDPFPPPFYVGYLNQPHVQKALGVPVNFTQSTSAVSTAFRSIGDYPRPGWLEDLEFLLENNIKVHLMYGDRDFACNWMGGEAVSLAINHTGAEAFRSAGYTDIVINDTYIGGQVRQHGNLSFSRVYQAGHEIPSYQPETSYKMFVRALFNRDIATGEVDTAGDPDYATEGPDNTWHLKNTPPPDLVRFCYLRDISATCTWDQYNAILNGTAVISNGILVDKNSTSLFPELVQNGTGGSGGGNSTVTPSPTSSSQASPTTSDLGGNPELSDADIPSTAGQLTTGQSIRIALFVAAVATILHIL